MKKWYGAGLRTRIGSIFYGEQYFQMKLPVEASSMSRFRNRIGELGCELLLLQTVSVGVQSKTVKARDFKRITVDSTVQEKAVMYPTDAKLLNRSRRRLVKQARAQGLVLRQS